MKNVVAALVELSAELRPAAQPRRRHLAAATALEEFKRGFANREQPWRTSEIVCDPAAYARLSAGRERRRRTSSPPTGAPRARPDRRFGSVRRGRAGEGEGVDRLAAVAAPGRLAEGADRVEGDRALVFLQPSRLVQVVAATS